ncbi:MAG TPA: hypothetical protein PKD61_24325 [Polyangiaceae bacterium]|nr:hypothetical protein [Polyangiaceae bacterium]
MADFLNRLIKASQWGAVLALGVGCGGESDSDTQSTGGASSGGASSGGASTGGNSSGGAAAVSSGGVSGGTGLDASADASLPSKPYPKPAGCDGPSHEGGYWGQCCEKVGCTQPVNGACPANTDLYGKLPGYPSGSGSCSCGTSSGPFAPHDPATEAACCYLFSSIGCDGRPLVVGGQLRLARVVRRLDWARLRPAA